jgi:hypothetical protein
LNPNTLFFFFIYWYLPKKPNFRSHASTHRGAATLFFCCCRVFWLSGPGFQDSGRHT